MTYLRTILYDTIVKICLNHQQQPDWSCQVSKESKKKSTCSLVDHSKQIDPLILAEANQSHLLNANLFNLREVTREIILKIIKSVDHFPR
jgi:hypothetical protein